MKRRGCICHAGSASRAWSRKDRVFLRGLRLLSSGQSNLPEDKEVPVFSGAGTCAFAVMFYDAPETIAFVTVEFRECRIATTTS